MPKKKKVPDAASNLRAGAKTFEAKAKAYGDNYRHYGTVMNGLFPRGLTINSKEDWDRLGLVHNVVTKLGRYCNDISKPHVDSAHDLMVYGAMLEERSK